MSLIINWKISWLRPTVEVLDSPFLAFSVNPLKESWETKRNKLLILLHYYQSLAIPWLRRQDIKTKQHSVACRTFRPESLKIVGALENCCWLRISASVDFSLVRGSICEWLLSCQFRYFRVVLFLCWKLDNYLGGRRKREWEQRYEVLSTVVPRLVDMNGEVYLK